MLVFGRHASPPETISLDLPLQSLPADHYAHHLVARMQQAHEQFRAIKADLRQRELGDIASHDLHMPDGKLVYLRRESAPSKSGQKSRFVRNFDGPFIVSGNPHGRQDLLKLRHATSGQDWPHPVNVEKIVVVTDTTPSDSSPLATVEDVASSQESVAPVHPASPNKDLADVAYRLGTFLEFKSSKSVFSIFFK